MNNLCVVPYANYIVWLLTHGVVCVPLLCCYHDFLTKSVVSEIENDMLAPQFKSLNCTLWYNTCARIVLPDVLDY